ncbi:MAG: hypothetical protein HY894_08975 [Deltaproteobacteria bacterium]|nr:hypothetical protein [Deltaproteobacteria bacterium]
MPPKDKHDAYVECPMCDVEVPISQDDKVGDQIFCVYCSTPLKIRKRKDTDELFLEEDF